MKKYDFAIVGATGMVGRTFIKVLEERNLPIGSIYFFASARSAGSSITFLDKEYFVEELNEHSFDRKIDIALFSAGGDLSKIYAPIAKQHGTVVIDNSSAWRMDPSVPLVVPEVNKEDIEKHNGIIANPNCSTIQALVAVKPLHDAFKVKRMIVTTFQSVSGAGKSGCDELEDSLRGLPPKKFPHAIANNCIPHIDTFLENGYTKEEMKMVNETRKMFHKDDLRITCTCVRVPVMRSHSETVNLEFEKQYDLKDVYEILNNAPGVMVVDDVKNAKYPLATEAADTDSTYVGRIRRDESVENGLNMWVVADNVRKGAATNAVQIAEELIKIWEK
ncbi:MAG: aspartate-semialdehyde dehydrogenase [Clostridia bacterium]|jgi:aspartate-semialdehyde dehydrogenase|nr:aspartate-semialdehyde dehydrogenase [Clostridia bacterium]MDD4501640.1 aspartate-semialdehyde dehydrogenase [Clostridia bacterium]NLV33278.1 aspartate-semialdehyde dehydrogenase [Clostridiaceae bacterium]